MNSELILELKQLSYRYPNGNRALDGVSFTVSEGEVVGVVGPSGAGKSTLLMHFNGLLPEKMGSNGKADASPEVTVAGMRIAKENLHEIRKLVGFLFQDPDDQLFCPTVREDVAFGPLNLGLPKNEIEKRISQSLAAVGLDDFEFRSTLQLSMGERKRVCLAGIFACQPRMLALDEPTSNLDPRARRQLMGILKSFDGAQIIATHDLDFVVEICNRVVVIDRGRLHADGSPPDVLSNPVLMERHGLEVPLRLRLGQSD